MIVRAATVRERWALDSEHVRSEAEVAIRSEILAKVLCHNLVCPIHEMHELGIDPTFGAKPAAEPEPRILRFPG